MNHVVFLLPAFLVVVNGTVEDQVSRLELFEWYIDRQSVVLVGLVPAIQFKAKVIPKVVDNLSYKGTAVEEDLRVIMNITRLVISLGIWNAEVFFATIDKFLAQLTLELRVSPVLLRCSGHIVAILNLLLLTLSEVLKVLLQSAFRFNSSTYAYQLRFRLGRRLLTIHLGGRGLILSRFHSLRGIISLNAGRCVMTYRY